MEEITITLTRNDWLYACALASREICDDLDREAAERFRLAVSVVLGLTETEMELAARIVATARNLLRV